jgi:hypothetical protein
MAFPAEVTGAFLAAREVLGAPNQYDLAMLIFLGILIFVNIAVYYHYYKVTSPFYILYVSVGFFLWAVSIDSERLKDFFFGFYQPIIPLLLILYTMISAFLALPKATNAP